MLQFDQNRMNANLRGIASATESACGRTVKSMALKNKDRTLEALAKYASGASSARATSPSQGERQQMHALAHKYRKQIGRIGAPFKPEPIWSGNRPTGNLLHEDIA